MTWIIILSVILVVLGIYIAFLMAFTSRKKHQDDTPSVSINEWRANQFGKAGEIYVAKYLASISSSYGGYLYNDFCFESEGGHSSEIDHILITRGGLFVIETKTNKGVVYGNEDDDKWMCLKKDYQNDKTFKNPIKQNRGHINHLREVFNTTPPKMISMVIFPVANISNINCDHVYNLKDALRVITELTNQNKYSDSFVKKINDQILDIKYKYGISKERHIENIRRKYQQSYG